MSVLNAQAQQLVEDGLSHEQIEQHLIGQGHPPEQVKKVVASYSGWIDELGRREVRNEGYATGQARTEGLEPVSDLLLGVVLLGLGLVGSMTTNYLFYGAVLVGMLKIGRGLVNLASQQG